ncbi:hypothetical protein CHX26_12455 [Porphyrobacter sp. HT-58-2]|uniref:hypothetical protein n=1 Tax=Porphyrobacter sp. HT-58-2 TaxID=2023229 RepID=UPI000CDBB5CB|nr:hypothetical protein [Porphyrobacter sp. HT-58-2]AUX70192.1 hypothetical protein CHX26_12455 [Porphyrobacter sp. HT-58-2]
MQITIKMKLLARRIQGLAAAMHAPQWVGITLNIMTAACAVVLAWLIYDTSLAKETALWGKAFLFGIGLLTAFATLAVSWQPGECSTLQRIFSPFGAGLILIAVFGAFGTMTSALSLFEPRAVTTQDIAPMEEGVSRIEQILARRFPARPPIFGKIEGRWGEQDPECGLVWEIALIEQGGDAALVAEMVKRPPGVEPFRLLAQIVKAEGWSMEVVGVEPASAKGRAASFRLDPAIERLAWDDKTAANGMEVYKRCPAG